MIMNTNNEIQILNKLKAVEILFCEGTASCIDIITLDWVKEVANN